MKDQPIAVDGRTRRPNRLRRLLVSFSMIIMGCVASCHRSPDEGEHFANAIRLLDQYQNTNVLVAEAAMLELEKYTRECEKAGSRDIKFDEHYAAIYSRLYLVEGALGKRDAADQFYRKASEYWQKVYARRGMSQPSPEEMRNQVEGVDRHFQQPQWKGGG